MLSVYAASQDRTDPLAGLVVGERPAPQAQPGWTVVSLRTSGLNHHDLWSLMGVGLSTTCGHSWESGCRPTNYR